jgi:nucleotidyltransferase
MNFLDRHIERIFELCRLHKVKSLYAFGSVLTPRFNEDSDVDLLVDFNESEIPLLNFGDNFFGLQFALEDMFGRKVDLICDNVISNSVFRKEVDSTKRIIYG